jgi:hypothetical protein
MIQRALADGVTAAVLGPTVLEHWLEGAPTLHRHFFDTPRRRSRHADIAVRATLSEAARLVS